MSEITASLVKELRERTGAGMMDCKKALTATDGDPDAAADWLRTKGLSAAAKRSGKVAAEGLVGIAFGAQSAAIVEINSETDFVARNDLFQAFVKEVAGLALESAGDVDALAGASYPGAGRTVAEETTNLTATIGEQISVRRAQAISVEKGVVATYIHGALSPRVGRIGVAVALESEGDPAKLPALPKFTAGWQLDEPDLIVKMTEPFPVPAEGRDIYRSFVVPLNLPKDKWLKAIEFRPGTRSVVHHCLFSYDTTGEARRLDRADRQPGFRRMRRQGRGVGSLGGWAVGGQPRELPDDLAWHLPKAADLVLSMHYHPSGKPERDQSSIGLYFTDQPPRTAFAGVQLPPAFGALSGVDIPAGNKAYKVTDSFTLPIAVEAFAISAHAHYLGKHLQMTATLPTGKQLNLLDIPDWDFSWQEQYQFRDFIKLPKGTRLDSMVVWDNSAANPNNPTVPPVRVRWFFFFSNLNIYI